MIYLASNQAEAYYKAHREYKELEKSGASQSVLKLKADEVRLLREAALIPRQAGQI